LFGFFFFFFGFFFSFGGVSFGGTLEGGYVSAFFFFGALCCGGRLVYFFVWLERLFVFGGFGGLGLGVCKVWFFRVLVCPLLWSGVVWVVLFCLWVVVLGVLVVGCLVCFFFFLSLGLCLSWVFFFEWFGWLVLVAFLGGGGFISEVFFCPNGFLISSSDSPCFAPYMKRVASPSLAPAISSPPGCDMGF